MNKLENKIAEIVWKVATNTGMYNMTDENKTDFKEVAQIILALFPNFMIEVECKEGECPKCKRIIYPINSISVLYECLWKDCQWRGELK